jgi:predicted nucleic acid-binding Zn ribbon protein
MSTERTDERWHPEEPLYRYRCPDCEHAIYLRDDGSDDVPHWCPFCLETNLMSDWPPQTMRRRV